MKEICKKHFEDLHQKITKITTNDRGSQTLIEWIEGCFIVSEKAWAQLKEELERHKFENKQEEIWFFKSMKPQFTGLIKYFTLLYRAELFVPNEAAAFILFWQQELKRIQCFFDKNASFYAYFKSGETHHDDADQSAHARDGRRGAGERGKSAQADDRKHDAPRPGVARPGDT